MNGNASPGQTPAAAALAGLAGTAGGFRLMRYFTITTLVAFVAVALVLFVLQRGEETFFEQVQQQQAAFFARAQATLARQHEEAARASLLAVHETSHVNLTRLVANMLWTSDFAPFVARAQKLSVERCRAIDAKAIEAAAAASAPNPRRACLAELGSRIRALPGFQALDAKAYGAMRSSTVFKIKVWDLRGITVYSSEHVQIGDDGAANMGWQAAAAGRPTSELTHRDRFSAFEGVVENRDLISTYVPVRADGAGAVLGVVELYSDVTPFLEQIKAASKRFAAITAANEATVAKTAADNQNKVDSSSDRFLVIVLGLLALLYGVSLLIVRNGQRLIDKQTREQEQAAEREQQWHREKMAALATMAANVSHEVGNPLAIIAGLAQELPESAPGPGAAPPARQILEQTARVAAMMRQISDFAAARSRELEWVDVNTMVKAVCDFYAFDSRFRATPIELVPGAALPACQVVPDHLNEVLMNLLLAWVDAGSHAGSCPGLKVETSAHGQGVQISVGGKGQAAAGAVQALLADGRTEPMRRRLQAMGAELAHSESAIQIRLPGAPPA